MKRFSKILALGLAAVMTFGMTVSAEESVSADKMPDLMWVPADRGIMVGGENVAADVEVKVEALGASAYEVAKESVKTEAAAIEKVLADAGVKAAADKAPVFLGAVDIDITGLTPEQWEKGVEIPLTVPGGVKSNMRYVVLHDGVAIPASVKVDVITVTVKHCSTFVIVGQEVQPVGDNGGNDEYYNNRPYNTDPSKSPATGETLPMVTMMALICLAGAAVCRRKAALNK